MEKKPRAEMQEKLLLPRNLVEIEEIRWALKGNRSYQIPTKATWRPSRTYAAISGSRCLVTGPSDCLKVGLTEHHFLLPFLPHFLTGPLGASRITDATPWFLTPKSSSSFSSQY
jgi:hypothetical protein